MKKVLILVIILLLCLPFVVAESATTIKDGWIRYYDSFSSNGNDYDIYSANAHHTDANNAIIIIKKNGESVTQVRFGQCESTIDYKYCFENRTTDSQLIDIDSKGNLQPALKVKLIEYSYEDGLEISRSFSKTNLYLDETAEVVMTVKNTGDYPITNISVFEDVPKNMKITSYDPRLAKSGNLLRGKFTLYPGSTWSAKYFVKALLYNTTETYATTVNYLPENRNETLSKSSSDVTLTVITPYTVDAKLSSSSIDIENKIIFTLEVHNEEDTPIEVSNIHVRIPSKSSSIVKDGLKQDGRDLYVNDLETLDVDQSQIYSLEAIFKHAGEYEFIYSGTVSTKGYSYDFSDSIPFEVVTEGISCSIITSDPLLDSGQEYWYAVVVNNNDNEMFYEVQGSTQYLSNEYLENVPQKNKRTLLNATKQAPITFDAVVENITFSGKYRSVTNQWFDLECDKFIDVTPIDRSIELVVTGNKNLARGESLPLTVQVNNLVNAPLNGVTIFSNDWSKKIALSALENRTIGSFNISIPQDFSGSELRTIVNASIPAITYEDSVEIVTIISNPLNDAPSSSSNQDSSSSNRDSSSSTSDSVSSTPNDSSDDSVNDEIIISKKTKDAKDMTLMERIKALFSSIFG